MKRKTAKEILAESFREIADKKPVDKITVVDIADNCGYSTTTFYRHFRDKYDLIAWDYTHGLEKMLEKISRDGNGWREACFECSKLFNDQRSYLKNLLLHTSGFDAFERNMVRIHYEGLKNMILRAADAGAYDLHLEMCVKTYCHGVVDLSCDWILGQYDVTPEALTKVFEDALPNILSVYLVN